MKYEIVTLPHKTVVGVKTRTTNENNKAMQDIGATWQTFMSLAQKSPVSGRVNDKTIGLYCNYEGDCTKPYDFLACCEVSSAADNLPEQYSTLYIPKGKYAKFVIEGDVVTAVAEFWLQLWQLPLNRGYTYDFEEYQGSSEDMQNQQIVIYISLK